MLSGVVVSSAVETEVMKAADGELILLGRLATSNQPRSLIRYGATMI